MSTTHIFSMQCVLINVLNMVQVNCFVVNVLERETKTEQFCLFV